MNAEGGDRTHDLSIAQHIIIGLRLITHDVARMSRALLPLLNTFSNRFW